VGESSSTAAFPGAAGLRPVRLAVAAPPAAVRAQPAEPLLERTQELARIEAALAEACAGNGTFVVVEGPAGIGKTALLATARAGAAGRGMRVLRSRGTELERDFAFGVVRQLFEPVLAEASDLERARLLEGGLPPSPVDPSFAILHGLYWLCANLAADAPLFLVVDDAHWADAPSLRFLAFLLTRLRELDVALAVATRPCEAGTDAELLAAVKTDPSAELIRLPPLTRAAVAQLVAARLGARPDEAFVDACVHATRGVPFLVGALVDALSEEGIPATAGAAHRVERIGAQTVGRSIELRLRRLPDRAGRLARALAVLEESELLTAARLAGLDGFEAAEAAEELVSAGFLESERPLRFVHPIVRSSIYSELSAAERAQSHRRAAQLLAELLEPNESVAQHLLATEPAADGWVVEQLVGAARKVARSGAPESAAVFLRRALEEPPPPDEQWGLLLELGTVEASAALDGWHGHLQRAVEGAPDAVSSAAAARVLARALNRDQRFAEAVEVLERAVSALDSRHALLASQLEAAAVVVGINDPATAPAMASRHAALRKRAADDPEAPSELVAAASFVSALMNEPADVAADLATRVVLAARLASAPAGRPWFSSALLARTAFALFWAERYAQVRPVLDAGIAEARAAGDGGRFAAGLATRAWLALRLGDLSDAEADARTALATPELPAPPMYRVLNAGVLVKALVDQGDLEAAEEALAPHESEAERMAVTAAVLRLARGRLRVEQGRLDDGLEDFLEVGKLLSRAWVISPSYLPWRSEAALVQLALGDRRSARHLAEEELELARAFGTPRALGVAKRAAGLVAGGERGASLLREAVDDFDRAGARLERARALLDLGASLRRGNRRTEARSLLREALDLAHRSGARRLAEQIETELRATGARPRRVLLTGLESLTASERRVAELAGQGLTNREIAQQLFVTARTVEGHLTSVFRKLQLDSRNDLSAALDAG
jgi:DNA-binding CsgD family transcriptional regulator